MLLVQLLWDCHCCAYVQSELVKLSAENELVKAGLCIIFYLLLAAHQISGMPEEYTRHASLVESPSASAGCWQRQIVSSSSCCFIDNMQRLQSCASNAVVGPE